MTQKKKDEKNNVSAFVNRKLIALNAVGGYKAEKAMNRVISKNKGVLA